MTSKFWSVSGETSSSDESGGENENSLESNDKHLGIFGASEGEVTDPNLAWKAIQEKQVFLSPLVSTTSRRSDCVRIVCISDTHGKHRDVHLPAGDILLHGGDFTKSGEVGSISELSAYFRCCGFSEVICIAGNHDMTLQPSYYQRNWNRFHREPFNCEKAKDALRNCIYLEDSSYTTRQGIEIYGSPWSPDFFNWAFNLPRGGPCKEAWKKIPKSTDVLITHGPPLGRGDKTQENGHAGCYDLMVAVQERVKPRVHVFGHIHEAAGVTFDGETLYVNASSLNIAYQVAHFPVILDVPRDKGKQAMVVPPDCSLESHNLAQWLKKKKFDRILHLLNDCDPELLPSGNEFFTEGAYEDLCSALKTHRDRNASHELRVALSKLYAESFAS